MGLMGAQSLAHHITTHFISSPDEFSLLLRLPHNITLSFMTPYLHVCLVGVIYEDLKVD